MLQEHKGIGGPQERGRPAPRRQTRSARTRRPKTRIEIEENEDLEVDEGTEAIVGIL